MNNIYDVIIVGGGPAGFSAAVNCARLKLKVLIIEQNGYFGGANVASDSGTIGGLFNSTKDISNPCQLVTGFAKEFSDLLEKEKGLYRYQRFYDTWLSPHNVFIYKKISDYLAREAGVNILFNTTFLKAEIKNKLVKKVSAITNGVEQTFKAKIFIDASGVGVLAEQAKIPYWYGKDNHVQSFTTTFRVNNVTWQDDTFKAIENVENLVERANQIGYNLPRTKPFIFQTWENDEALINATSFEQEYENGTISAFDSEKLAIAEIELRQQVQRYYYFLRNFIPGFEVAKIKSVAEKIGVRQTRSFKGLYVLKNDDVVNAKKFEHAIVRSAWPIEIHKGAEGVSIFSLDEDYYEIPYECFVPQEIDNLFFLGKIMSAEHEALASARVVAQCLEEGKAFAYAAKLQIDEQKTNKEIDPLLVRKWMIETGSNL